MTYNVWMEGFRLSGEGEQAQAEFVGAVEANSFQEACDKVCLARYAGIYDTQHRTVWGCRLFDNESDARKSFG